MNKRITSLLLCFVMVFAMLATAVPALAAPITSTQIKVIPDKTTASPGDIITYSIVLGPVSDMGSMQMVLDIPTGLTYVENSGKLTDGLRTALGFDVADWTEVTKMVNGFASAADYESATDTELAKFQCKVDDGATGSLEVGLTNLEFGSCQTFEYHTDRFSVVKTPVTITAAPKPATDIKLNKNTLELTVGESQTLVATVEPADTTDTVTWDTGRSDVATVDSTGKVTAVAPGTAVIAARAGEKSAFCTVTVVAAPCTHTNKTYIGEKPSTCTEQGWDAYSRCDDCGQRFDMEGNPISEIPFRALADHTGGTATCTHKAVCTVCGNEYGNLAEHSYTANTKKPEALKTAGTCKDKAIYLRSCEVCGKVAPSEAWGTFYGDIDPNNHAGGTTTVNASEPDHKNQVAGYTGDTKCLGCEAIIAHGTAIAPGEHTPASTWNSDGEYHWKTCTVAGCGVIIDGSKAAHTSTGANVATCQHKAICDVCNVEYGEKAAHNPASGWTNDASGHWHACQTAGCTEKSDFAAHTPDREAATETDPIKCSECDYIITPALGHTHSLTKVEAKAPTCTEDGNIEYYTCSGCSKLFADATGNVEITADKTVDKATGHTYEWVIDKEATATEKGSKHEECKVCHDKKAAVEIPATGTPTDPTKPENPDSPQTGDNSMMGLWIALLFVSGAGVAGTTVYSRKRKSVK